MLLDLVPAPFLERLRALSPEGVALAEKARHDTSFLGHRAHMATFTSPCGRVGAEIWAWSNYGLVLPGAYTTNGYVGEAECGVACQLGWGYTCDRPELVRLFDYETDDPARPTRLRDALWVTWKACKVQMEMEERLGR